MKRAIVVKLAIYKDKQNSLSKCNRLKGTDIYINKNVLKETLEIGKMN